MESANIISNVIPFESVDDAFHNHTPNRNKELNLNDINESTDSNQFEDYKNTKNSENNLFNIIPAENTGNQSNENDNVRDVKNYVVDGTPIENTKEFNHYKNISNSEDNSVCATPVGNTERQDNENDFAHDVENNFDDATSVENTEENDPAYGMKNNLVGAALIKSTKESNPVLDAKINLVDDDVQNPQENEPTHGAVGSDVENMDPYELERSKKEISPLKSPVPSVSSGPASPYSDLFDSTSNKSDGNENIDRVSRKDFSLPYFQLPKPDLDEFLVQTDEFLSGNKRSSLSSPISLSKKHTASKRKSILDEFLVKYSEDESPQLQKIHAKYDDSSTRSLISQEYLKVISCIGQLDESKSPGIKRLALKEFLQKKINERKSAAFNRSKEIMNLDENEEIDETEEMGENNEEEGEGIETDKDTEAGENDEIESSVFEEEEKINSGADSSDEDLEEPSVLLLGEKQKNVTNLDDEMNHLDSDESDEDILSVRRKPKRLQVLDEASDDEACVVTDFIHEDEQKNGENNFDSQNGSFSNGPSADTQIKMGFVDIPSYQPAVSFCENTDESSQDSLTLQTYKRENFKDSLNFAESNLSSQNSSPIPLSMDDPPLMLSGNAPLMGDIFLSQDIAAVCSGAFKGREENNLSKHKDEIMSHCKDASVKEASFVDEIDEDKDSEKDIQAEAEDEEKINEFLDLEAELSGEDDGEEDPESDAEGIDDLIAADHEVPSNAEVRDEIVDLHLKHLIDDDEEVLHEIKEKFLDDGELHGDGRTRRFAWKNNVVDTDDFKNGMSSESEDEAATDSWASISQEKAKWRVENKEEELDENLSSSYNKNLLKVKIIGKSNFCQTAQDSSRRLSCKRPRGSFLNLDNSSAAQFLKKLKASEDMCGGSRTTKHFVFRNDLSEETKVVVKEVTTVVSQNTTPTVNISNRISTRSIFSKI